MWLSEGIDPWVHNWAAQVKDLRRFADVVVGTTTQIKSVWIDCDWCSIDHCQQGKGDEEFHF